MPKTRHLQAPARSGQRRDGRRWAAVLLLCTAATATAAAPPPPADSTRPDHSLFTAVLQDHVRDGAVDYRAIKQDARFARYIDQLRATDPETIPATDRLAFWLDVYNAFTIKVVVDQYPIKSILSKFAYLFGRSNFQKKLVQIHGREMSLNEIEHEIVRPFGDPRVHFALVCASKGCPPLRAEAYESARLAAQLDEQARLFLAQTDKNRIDFDKRVARLSKVFAWFEEDFEAQAPSVLAYISRYLPAAQGARLRAEADQFKIKYTHWDWDLNDLPESGVR